MEVCRVLLQSSGEAVKVIVPVEIFQHLVTILEMGNARRHPGAFKLCSIGIEIVENSDAQQRLQLKSLLFLRLTEWIARGFKEEYKVQDAKQSCLASVVLLLQDVQSFDLDTLKSVKPGLILKIVRSCLKYGISLAEQSPAQSSLSLQLATTILDRIGDPTSHLAGLDILGAPIASILNLLQSHSKFEEVLSSASPEVEIVKLQLVRLISCCIRLSPEGCTMNVEVWTSLFAGFDCGLSALDTEIRKLFAACCDVPGEVSKRDFDFFQLQQHCRKSNHVRLLLETSCSIHGRVSVEELR